MTSFSCLFYPVPASVGIIRLELIKFELDQSRFLFYSFIVLKLQQGYLFFQRLLWIRNEALKYEVIVYILIKFCEYSPLNTASQPSKCQSASIFHYSHSVQKQR